MEPSLTDMDMNYIGLHFNKYRPKCCFMMKVALYSIKRIHVVPMLTTRGIHF